MTFYRRMVAGNIARDMYIYRACVLFKNDTYRA